ncbi:MULTISPECIES: DUF1353 domain-containing protein [Pseudomonas]|uniref:DUF1353 domain-containing protein n=1 Tax=Pseudomonas juntendi TaxID=2666183 RepID=A0ABD4YBH1_9PSED|nr:MULTISPECIES: DUF1353 domain-containing protein [Pseudomonas]EGB99542.1 hypothetical protein G1E_07693 [Pseudomonas sp. TJI-51]MBA6121636.1 DUF1353 domain-containing protein [Pseudomonas juntendi]MBR7523093.1 DUF1353 domain-containing protein [Pseudomonas juntendi]MCF3155415.1 DUF1353 domain-containing protein [Pseudomonas juntendi]MCI0911115.1 DUF1353 domain-containing protein [Pseudomonas putida]
MSGFTDEHFSIKWMEEVDGVDYWASSSFRYWIGPIGTGRYVDVPAGFITDGASVPRPFWSMIPPWGTYGQAAIVHDYLCETLTVQLAGVPIRITRKECDGILLQAMTDLGVPLWKRSVIYGAVRAYALAANVTQPSGLVQLPTQTQQKETPQ